MNNQMKQIYQQVKDLLVRFPRMRDSDSRLIANIWTIQIGIVKMNQLSARQLLEMMIAGQLINQHSIARARRMVQEDFVELQGLSYKKRKKKEVEVRKDFATR